MVLIQKPDAALEADIARLVSLIASVQETEGYIKAHQKARSPLRAGPDRRCPGFRAAGWVSTPGRPSTVSAAISGCLRCDAGTRS